MAKINRSDILKTITQGSGKDFYLFEIVVNRFIEEIKQQLQAGNVVNIQGLGRFYVDVKKNGATRATFIDQDTGEIGTMDGKYFKYLNYNNLSSFHFGTKVGQSPDQKYSSKRGFAAIEGVRDFGGYARVKMSASKKMCSATHVLRFKSPRYVRTQYGSLVNVAT